MSPDHSTRSELVARKGGRSASRLAAGLLALLPALLAAGVVIAQTSDPDGLSREASGGKSLLDILAEDGKTLTQQAATKGSQQFLKKFLVSEKEPLTSEEYDVLDLFSGSKFEFEEALHAKYTMDALRFGKKPLPLEKFQKILKSIESKGNIAQTEQSGKKV